MKFFQTDGAFHPVATGRELRRNAVRGAGAAIAGSAGNFVVQMGSVVLLARLLMPADFGVVAMVTTFSLLLRSFGLNGFLELIMQREELNESLASNFFWINVGIGTILTGAFACLGSVVAHFYHTPAAAAVTRGMAPTIVIGCLGYVHLGLLQRAMRFRATAVINFVGQILQYAASIGLAFAGFHYWALVWGSIVQTASVSIGAWVVCRWIPKWPRRAAGTEAGFRFAMNVYAHFAFSYSTRNTDNLLVGWRFGDRALGFYKRAYDLFVLPETQLLVPLSAVAVSTLSRVNRDREQFQRYFLRIIAVLALVGMGVGTDFALIGEDLVRFLFGRGWEEAGRVFALFGPGIGVMLLYNTHGWIHLSIGRPERWFKWGLLEFLCTVSIFLLTLHWGPSGIALAWTVSYFLLMFPGFWYAGNPIGLRIGTVLRTVWKFFAASFVAGVGTFVVFHAFTPLENHSSLSAAFLRIVIVTFSFAVLYCGCVIVFHKSTKPLTETAKLVRELLPQQRDDPKPTDPLAKTTQERPERPVEAKLKPEFAVASESATTACQIPR